MLAVQVLLEYNVYRRTLQSERQICISLLVSFARGMRRYKGTLPVHVLNFALHSSLVPAAGQPSLSISPQFHLQKTFMPTNHRQCGVCEDFCQQTRSAESALHSCGPGPSPLRTGLQLHHRTNTDSCGRPLKHVRSINGNSLTDSQSLSMIFVNLTRHSIDRRSFVACLINPSFALPAFELLEVRMEA
jgi:hypothetical protein